MASLPLSGTNIRFLSGVPFFSDYKNVRLFDNVLQQTTYFQNRSTVHTMSQAKFIRQNNTTIVKADKNIDDMLRCGYVMFQNEKYGSKWFYGFVTKVEYDNPNHTVCEIKLDVFQTWYFDVTFKGSFVEREHRKLWSSSGQPQTETVDENLDYGVEYDIVGMDHLQKLPDIGFAIIITTQAIERAGDGGTDRTGSVLGGVQTPYTTYVVPFVYRGVHAGSTPTVNGVEVTRIEKIYDIIKDDVDIVNSVVSITTTSWIGTTVTGGTQGVYMDNIMMVSGNGLSLPKAVFTGEFKTESFNLGKWKDKFPNQKQSKLLMSPYTLIELTDFRGSQQQIRPEYINNNDGDLVIQTKSIISHAPKTAFQVEGYNVRTLPGATESWNHAVIDDGMGQIPVMTDYASAFFQANGNSIRQQRSQANNNAIAGIIGGAVGMTGSIATANPLGIMGSAAGIGSSILGGYHSIKQINAKLNDINNVPTNMSRLGDNNLFEFGHDITGVYVVYKQVKPEYKRKLEDFFHMFGYQTNEVKQLTLKNRQHFNFVKTQNVSITGNINAQDLEELRAIFDQGVTLWHVDDVGNYMLNNLEV